jgi:hypothetical protein
LGCFGLACAGEKAGYKAVKGKISTFAEKHPEKYADFSRIPLPSPS